MRTLLSLIPTNVITLTLHATIVYGLTYGHITVAISNKKSRTGYTAALYILGTQLFRNSNNDCKPTVIPNCNCNKCSSISIAHQEVYVCMFQMDHSHQ